MKTGGLWHDGSSEKSLGQYFPSFFQTHKLINTELYILVQIHNYSATFTAALSARNSSCIQSS